MLHATSSKACSATPSGVPLAAERRARSTIMQLRSLARLPQRVLMAAVRAYRLVFSPWVGNACRFEPTCSAYSLHALDRYGAAIGTYLTLRRLARCHPWCAGGHDPVPEAMPALFHHLVAAAATTPAPSTSTPTAEPHP